MSGKGSKPRPYSVSQSQFANNWNSIFRKSTKDWYLLAINPWYKILFNPTTKKCKQIDYK